jgi:hypothetical protein
MIQLYTYAPNIVTRPSYFIYNTATKLRCSYASDIFVVIKRSTSEPFCKSHTFDPKHASLLAEGPTLQDCINSVPELFI